MWTSSVNVYNSNVGDYILPIRNDDNSITGVSISSNSITFDQYKLVVGKVLKILDDGRAFIKVMHT